jgi:hypothetical protein
MANAKRGLVRLGIVLSVIWLAVVSGRVAYELTDSYLETYWVADTIYTSRYWNEPVERPTEFEFSWESLQAKIGLVGKSATDKPDFSKFGAPVQPISTRPWREVKQSDAFLALPSSERDEARTVYFAEVVAPRVPRDRLDFVRGEFFSQTELDIAPPEHPFDRLGGWKPERGLPVFDPMQFLAVALLPLLLVCGACWVTYIAAAWVRRGFADRTVPVANSGSQEDTQHAATPDSPWRPKSTRWKRWLLRSVAIVAALLVFVIWKGIERDLGGGGFVSGALRGGLIGWFLIWVWLKTARH